MNTISWILIPHLGIRVDSLNVSKYINCSVSQSICMTFRISDSSDSVGKQDKIKDYIKDEEMGNLTMLRKITVTLNLLK